MEQTEAWVMGLTVKTASDGCRFMRMLQAESMRSNEVYRYFDRFVEIAQDAGDQWGLKIHVMHEDIFNSMHRIQG